MKITKEVWYDPQKDEILCADYLGKEGWLMFRTEHNYYFYAISKKSAKANGIIFLGAL